MAEALRTLLVLETPSKASRILHELTEAGYAPRHSRVRSRRSLRSALRNRSWDLLVADAAGVLGSRHGVRIVSSDDDAPRCVRLQFEIANLTL